MNCREAQQCIEAYNDAELDPVKCQEIEEHLDSCPACRRAYGEHQALGSLLRGPSLRFQPPPDLRKRVEGLLRAEAGEARIIHFPKQTRSWLMAAACFALGALLAHFFWSPPGSNGTLLAREIIASHVRSLMLDNHLEDVVSTDRHTVKPWFNGKLDFSPPVADFAKDEFPLAGGRLDYLNGRSVATLVYKRGKHIINLMIWPSAANAAEADAKPLTEQGFHLFHWSANGMTFWAISDLNAREMRQFINLVQTSAGKNDLPEPTATP